VTTTTASPEPPATPTIITAPVDAECGCYAPDEEIPIENDKCVMNLGTFPDLKNNWTFTFDLKINSLPEEPTHPFNRWFLMILSAYMDGAKHPNKLLKVNYFQSEDNPNTINLWWMKSVMSFDDFIFQVDEWYKFTMTGSPDGDSCRQKMLIEGAGLVDGKWTESAVNPCLDLNEETPLKVFTSEDMAYHREGTPIDGVVKNFSFTNIASDTTMTNHCPA
jgi:hypothetical protein